MQSRGWRKAAQYLPLWTGRNKIPSSILTGISWSGYLVARYLLSLCTVFIRPQGLTISFTVVLPLRGKGFNEMITFRDVGRVLQKLIRNVKLPENSNRRMPLTSSQACRYKRWNNIIEAQSPRGGSARQEPLFRYLVTTINRIEDLAGWEWKKYLDFFSFLLPIPCWGASY